MRKKSKYKTSSFVFNVNLKPQTLSGTLTLKLLAQVIFHLLEFNEYSKNDNDHDI
jgi:hypothetical protein